MDGFFSKKTRHSFSFFRSNLFPLLSMCNIFKHVIYFWVFPQRDIIYFRRGRDDRTDGPGELLRNGPTLYLRTCVVRDVLARWQNSSKMSFFSLLCCSCSQAKLCCSTRWLCFPADHWLHAACMLCGKKLMYSYVYRYRYVHAYGRCWDFLE